MSPQPANPASSLLWPPAPQHQPRRVVITGAGIITALGRGWKANADAFRQGHCGIAPVTLFDTTRQRARLAAEAVPPEHIPTSHLNARRWQRTDRATRLLLTAAHEAWLQSGWTAEDPVPVVLGTTSAGMPLGEAYYRQATQTPSSRRQQATRSLHYQAQRQTLDLLDSLDATGPITLIANACASGTNAIGHAWELIRSGQNNRVLAGGFDGLCQLVFSGFDSLQALSTTRCRPFDAHRDGLALGEGAAVFTLEALESARKRSAPILGEIIGYGAATDIHHLTQPHPNGEAAFASMQAATRAARINPDQVQYINAHGTGTVLNDAAETAAINRWAGHAVAALRVSSTKGSVGHLLGGAGAVEAAICLMALNGQWIPPSPMTEEVDPACRFIYVRQPIDCQMDVALSNSFGFGGANATILLRRFS